MGSKAPIRRQLYAAICGNLLTASFGSMNGWATVNFVDLQKIDTKLPSGPLSLNQATLMMSIAIASSMVGILVFPFIVKKFGSKRTMFAVGFPQIMSWLLIIYAQNPYYLYASRIITGLVNAGLMICMPIFTLEICNDRIRGTLLSCFDPFMNFGTVTAFVAGKYFDYAVQAKFHLIVSLAYLILFARIPESPQHLVNVQREKAANKAHKFFTGTELEKLPVSEPNAVQDQDEHRLTLSDFTNHRARKAMFLACSMLILNVLQGSIILGAYVTEIFASSNANVSAIDASILITTTLIISNLIFLNVVDRAGRRTFYICSSLATAVGLTVFALYLYYLTNNRAFDWVPIVSLAYVLFVSCLGMNPVPFLVTIEILPNRIKNYGLSFGITLMMILTFILMEVYPSVKEYIGLFGWITFFAVTSSCNALFGIFFLPETKGRSYEEIMQALDK